MNYFKKTVLPIFLTGIWINLSETVRWELLIKSYWIEKYEQLGIVFPNEPINGIIWMIWGFLYAAVIYILAKKFNLLQTTLIAWFAIFVMMWIVVWNVGVLPTGMLWINAPLSLLEALVGVYICKKFASS